MAMINLSGLSPGQSHRNQTICKPSPLAWSKMGCIRAAGAPRPPERHRLSRVGGAFGQASRRNASSRQE